MEFPPDDCESSDGGVAPGRRVPTANATPAAASSSARIATRSRRVRPGPGRGPAPCSPASSPAGSACARARSLPTLKWTATGARRFHGVPIPAARPEAGVRDDRGTSAVVGGSSRAMSDLRSPPLDASDTRPDEPRRTAPEPRLVDRERRVVDAQAAEAFLPKGPRRIQRRERARGRTASTVAHGSATSRTARSRASDRHRCRCNRRRARRSLGGPPLEAVEHRAAAGVLAP
jgi:hypothetical protein